MGWVFLPDYLHTITLAELEALAQQRWPQQAAARGSKPCFLLRLLCVLRQRRVGQEQQMLPLTSNQKHRDMALVRRAGSQGELPSRILQTCGKKAQVCCYSCYRFKGRIQQGNADTRVSLAVRFLGLGSSHQETGQE